MRIRSIPRILLASSAVAALLLLALGLFRPCPRGDNRALSLQPPPFISAAYAQEAPGPSVIEKEAGIAAYCNTGVRIQLDTARTAFRTIEIETPEYILGSVPVPNYDRDQDVHAYVGKDGWALVYYLKEEPAAKILDWNSFTGKLIGTKLESALSAVCASANAPYYGPTFYDFRYPNATHMTIIVFDSKAPCYVKLPASFSYFERSCSMTSSYSDNYYYYVNDLAVIKNVGPGSSWTTLSATVLPPAVLHELRVEDTAGGLVLIYRVP